MAKSIFDIIDESSDLNKAYLNTLQPLSPLMSQPGDAATGDSIMSSTVSPEPKMNPMVKEALMKKLGQTAPSTEMPKMPAPEMSNTAESDYESGKVSPWLAFASGVGQTLQGKSPDLKWVDEQNKLVYDDTIGKLRLANKDAEEKRRFDAEMEYKNRALKENIAERRDRYNALRGEKADALTSKNKQSMMEIEDRRQNINAALDVIDGMIKDDGTWEAFGSHNQDMDRLIEQIATDMAKLQDPSSVARPQEVEAVKKTLVQPGFKNSNSTARDILSNFRGEVNRRTNSAYKIRGIEAPSGTPSAGETVTKTEIKRQYSPSRNQTKVIYSDGTSEVLDGKQ